MARPYGFPHGATELAVTFSRKNEMVFEDAVCKSMFFPILVLYLVSSVTFKGREIIPPGWLKRRKGRGDQRGTIHSLTFEFGAAIAGNNSGTRVVEGPSGESPFLPQQRI
ncbi:hypothetical protein TNCV_4352471 [Trichonephila clavipes]|nr:hypothetical protein TNCV_4352471 [Trichonephila clavipes]